MSDPLRDAIRAHLASTGESKRSLSLRVGKSDKIIDQILNKPEANPRHDTLLGLAKALGLKIEDLSPRPSAAETAPQYHPTPLEVEEYPPSNVRMAPGAPRLPYRGELPRDVPVMGTAAGSDGDGAFELNMGEPVDYVLRGAGIANAKQVFTIYIEGESMEPWRRAGGMAYLDPARKVGIGDHVVLVMHGAGPGDPPQAFIKRLVRRGADQVIVAQYNPVKELTFSARSIKQMIRVLEWEEVMGL